MMGLGDANPHHGRNGFFMHDQFAPACPRQSINIRLDAETAYSETTLDPDSALAVLERGDAHELGDLALTKYYDPAEDQGLQEHWLAIEGGMPAPLRPSLLGASFGPTSNYFDPGRMGSYFQTSEMAAESCERLLGRPEREMESFMELLVHVIQSSRGLYVTF